MEDIESDCIGFEYAEGRLHSEISSKKLSVEDPADSGLYSFGYFSGGNSLQFTNTKDGETNLLERDQPQINSLENSLLKLNISSMCGKMSDRCDSGLDDEKQFISTDSINAHFNWVVPSNFSEQQVQDIFRGDEDGDNHLHLSIIHGLSDVTMQIIGLAPDWDWLNQTNNLLQTALHIAVITRQLLVVRRLICAGASVEVRDQIGNTPLHNACRLGYEDVVRTLITPVEYKETLQNKYNIPFQRLPQDLESRNYEGLTCLHLAAIGGHINVMELLLSAGANVNAAEGKSGRTVLHFAVDWGNITMIKFLLSKPNTDINARTYGGLTPILLAYGRRNLDLVDELFNHGAVCDSLSLSEESDEDISDEKLINLSVSKRPSMVISHSIYQRS